jgi:hypothetical protein
LETNVPNECWLSIGFGTSMYDTNMVGFRAEGAGETLDTWATGHSSPAMQD